MVCRGFLYISRSWRSAPLFSLLLSPPLGSPALALRQLCEPRAVLLFRLLLSFVRLHKMPGARLSVQVFLLPFYRAVSLLLLLLSLVQLHKMLASLPSGVRLRLPFCHEPQFFPLHVPLFWHAAGAHARSSLVSCSQW